MSRSDGTDVPLTPAYVLLPAAGVLGVAFFLALKGQLRTDTTLSLLVLGIVLIAIGYMAGEARARRVRRVAEEHKQSLQALVTLSEKLAAGFTGSIAEQDLPKVAVEPMLKMQSRLRAQREQSGALVALEARVEHLNTLHSFIESFSGMKDLDLLLEGITDRCQEIFESQILLLWLLSDGGKASLKTFRGLDEQGLSKIAQAVPDLAQPFYQTVRDGDVLTVSDPAKEPDLAGRLPLADKTAYAIVPLRAGDQVLGLLEILTTDPTATSRDIRRLLGTLGREAGMVIHNVQLYFQIVDEKNRSQMLVQTIGEGVYSMDETLRIASFNQAAERLTGVAAADAVGKKCWEVFQGRDKDGELVCTPDKCIVRKALAEGTAIPRYELKLRLRDDSQVDVAFLPRTHQGVSGQAREVVSTFRDVTQAREIEQMRTNLLNTVTHELKTPLTSIKGCVATLTHPKANFTREAQKNFLGIIQEEADRLNHLITDLLAAAQLTSDVLVLKPQDMTLRPAVERVVSRYQGLSQRHTFLTDWMSPGDVVGDAERLEYVLQHLVSNAVKFSPQGGEIRVTVKEHKEESMVHVTVQDQGIGIPVHQRDRIFEVFHRLDVGDNRKTYGVGMGLYLARKIVEAHGGRIWVESVTGGGSCFTFSLPLAVGRAS